MYLIFFIHLSLDGHLGWLHFLAKVLSPWAKLGFGACFTQMQYRGRTHGDLSRMIPVHVQYTEITSLLNTGSSSGHWKHNSKNKWIPELTVRTVQWGKHHHQVGSTPAFQLAFHQARWGQNRDDSEAEKAEMMLLFPFVDVGTKAERGP